jgi:DNA-binding MarR family transcriptional regulator
MPIDFPIGPRKIRYHKFMNSASGNQRQESVAAGRWDFLTNHAHVLMCVAADPGIRLREIAAAVGITERAAHRILSELVAEGYVLREREGRRNRYEVVDELPLRHPLVRSRDVGDLLEAMLASGDGVPRGGVAPAITPAPRTP